jgi:hypothetical protein
MAELSKHMTRIVVIGKLESYEYKTTPFIHGKGVIDTGAGKVRFTIFNSGPNAQTPHTKATDFNEEFDAGDLVFITGQDNRSYSEEKDIYYEDVNVWDFRAATADEPHRWVFVYIADVKELNENGGVLSFMNYKDEEMLFHFNSKKLQSVPEDFEIGARVKMKGEIFNGIKMDYYGDGEFVTERHPVMVEVLHTKEEINSIDDDTSEEAGMWD